MDEDIKTILDQINALFEEKCSLLEIIEQSNQKLNEQQLEISELSDKLDKVASDQTDWRRLSDTLQNTLTLVTNSSDHSACDEKISSLKAENAKLANELGDLQTNFELKISEVEYKQASKWNETRSSLENQIEALKLTKNLVHTEVHEKCQALEQKCEQISSENREKYNQMVLHYEKLLQTIRLENADLEKENVQLIRDKENLKGEIHKSNLKLVHQIELAQRCKITSKPQMVDASTDPENVSTNFVDVVVDGVMTRKRKLYTEPRYDEEGN